MKCINEYMNMIQVNLHSSVRMEAEGKILYVDPFKLTGTPGDADLVFFTHSHFDHFSPEDVAKICKEDTVFVLPASMEKEAAQVTKGHPVAAVSPSERKSAAGISFETIPSYNPKKKFHPRKNQWVGYVIQVEGIRIYVAGDTDATSEAAEVSCDIALLPIGGTYTMDAEEAAALANRIRPQVVIPIHYGSVTGSPEDFDRFAPLVDPTIAVHRVI